MSEYLRIANSRGKKPVLNDIKKAILILDDITIEVNKCPALTLMNDARELLWTIIENEGYEISKNNTLIKK